MKSIIGKKYQSRDNSYEVNLTKPTELHEKLGRVENRPYLSLNKIECTIITEPFTINVYTGLNYIKREMLLVETPTGECISQLYHKDSIIN